MSQRSVGYLFGWFVSKWAVALLTCGAVAYMAEGNAIIGAPSFRDVFPFAVAACLMVGAIDISRPVARGRE